MNAGAASPAWSWRHAIIKSDLAATTRHILLTLSVFMNGRGEGCYPSITELAQASGLSARAVMTHIEKAVESGWLAREKHGFGGRKWRRNEYVAAWPERGICGGENDALESEAGSDESPEIQAQGGERGSPPQQNKVVNVVPQGGERGSPRHIDQSITSPKNPPSPPVGGGAGMDSELRKSETGKPGPNEPATPAFEDFKTAYGADPVMNWATGKREWDKLKPADRRAAVAGAPGYLADCRAKRQRVCGPSGFLRGRRFAAYGPSTEAAKQIVFPTFGKTWFRYFFDQLDPERCKLTPRFLLDYSVRSHNGKWSASIGDIPEEARISAMVAVPSDGEAWAAWKAWLVQRDLRGWPDWPGRRWLFVPSEWPPGQAATGGQKREAAGG